LIRESKIAILSFLLITNSKKWDEWNAGLPNAIHNVGIQVEIKRRLNSGNACSHLLSKDVEVRIYKTIILPVVLYGCETCSLTVREEHKLSVFENRVLRRIFGPKRDGVTGGWRKLHNEELHCTLHQV
jgi:hypothetical protein